MPDEVLSWRDPVPEHQGPLVSDAQIATLKQQIADSGLTAKQLVGTAWEPFDESEERFEGKNRSPGETKWTATRVDLIYGSNSQLRAIAEESNGGEERMIDRFVKGWVKVMENDRFDLHR